MFRLLLAAAVAATRVTAQSLADVLENQSDSLSIFTQYVQDAGLLDTLTSLDSATIFAPTNDAFSAILEAYPDLVMDDASSDDDDNDDSDSSPFSQRFLDILMYHVVPGVALAASDIADYPGVFYATALDGIAVNPYADEDGAKVFSAEKRSSTIAAAVNLPFPHQRRRSV